jgi:hypothetical protein
LMESVSSCIFLSQVLSCSIKSSSVFPLILISSSSTEIMSSAYSRPLKWPSFVFCISVSLFFLGGFPYHGPIFYLNLSLYLCCSVFHFGIYLGHL